jgi:hypothetical protein
MKKSLAIVVSVVALALVTFAPSKTSAQGVSIYIGPGYPNYGYGYGYYPRYSYGYGSYPSYGRGYYPRYSYGYNPGYYGYPRARRYVRRHVRRW